MGASQKTSSEQASQAHPSDTAQLPLTAEIGRDAALALYRTIVLIRNAEESLRDMFAAGEVPGFIHLSIGQEAVSAGVMSALGPEDTISSTHRGHGHAIAKGVALEGFFAELFARDEGLCRGRGGSMHVADLSVGMLGANGIVGAGLAIALGSALAHKSLKRSAIAVAFFGDGALAEGLLHETLNLAALWRLPLLLVCENNGWGEFLPTAKQISFALGDLASAYRIPHKEVDGNNALAVALAAQTAVSAVRRGDGPVALECRTTRMRGHFEGDNQKYRDPSELAAFAERDPIVLTARALAVLGITQSEIATVHKEVADKIQAATAHARRGAEADFEAAKAAVYTGAT
jgi:TPP-dependent pyruvate/acetoin dehydrogenase alpha subunit